jgi:transposase
MRILYQRCCGLDIHKNKIVACVMATDPLTGQVGVRKKEFGAWLKALRDLRFWLQSQKVTHVAMESTGVYWKPVWNVLEGRFTILLVNSKHFRGVPGRKTDMIDAEWLADLLRCGLLKSSFIPPKEIRELRDLTRWRVHLLEDANRAQNRLEQVLEDANIKLGAVVSDTLGVCARRMIRGVIEGKRDAAWMADWGIGRLRARRKELKLALESLTTDHHRWLLKERLAAVEEIEARVARVETEIRRRIEPHQELLERLDEIPGVDEVTVWTIISELGVDMEVFQTPERAASWAALCPGNRESAGKRKSGKTRKGNRYLRRALVQVAWAVSHCKDNYLRARYWRLAGKVGKKKAALAVAHQVLKVIFLMIRDQTRYKELGGNFYDKIDPIRAKNKLITRLNALGWEVTLTPVSPLPSNLPPTPTTRTENSSCH